MSRVIRQLYAAGVDYEDVVTTLEREGIARSRSRS
jgi:hypothetical protein